MDGTLDTTTTEPLAEGEQVVGEFEPSTCTHCGRLFQEGDSITLRGDGSIKQCQHWNLTPYIGNEEGQ